MAARKKSAAGAPSMCEQGGAEQFPVGIRVRVSDVVDFSAWVCSTAAHINAHLTDPSGARQPLINQQGSSHVTATLPGLTPGVHVLLWSFAFASSPWQTRSEVAVNQVNRFRHRKSDTSNEAVNRGFLVIEVVP